MIVLFTLLAGIVLAAFIFAALLWSVYRAVVTEGSTRLVAVLLSLNTLIGMGMLTLLEVIPALIAGVGLVILGALAIRNDPGWSKLLPFVQVIFGIVLIVGLPWIIG